MELSTITIDNPERLVDEAFERKRFSLRRKLFFSKGIWTFLLLFILSSFFALWYVHSHIPESENLIAKANLNFPFWEDVSSLSIAERISCLKEIQLRGCDECASVIEAEQRLASLRWWYLVFPSISIVLLFSYSPSHRRKIKQEIAKLAHPSDEMKLAMFREILEGVVKPYLVHHQNEGFYKEKIDSLEEEIEKNDQRISDLEAMKGLDGAVGLLDKAREVDDRLNALKSEYENQKTLLSQRIQEVNDCVAVIQSSYKGNLTINGNITRLATIERELSKLSEAVDSEERVATIQRERVELDLTHTIAAIRESCGRLVAYNQAFKELSSCQDFGENTLRVAEKTTLTL